MKILTYQRLILLLFFEAAFLIVLSDRTPLHVRESHGRFEREFNYYLDGVNDQTLQGPYVYRVAIPYIIGAIQFITPSVSSLTIDFALKVIILFCCQFFFWKYISLFLGSFESLAGVLLLDVLIGFSFSPLIGPTTVETSDVLNLLIFILAFISIYDKAMVRLYVLLFLGSFNRETPLFIPPLILLVYGLEKKYFIQTSAALFATAVPYVALRIFIHPADPTLFDFQGLARNIPFLPVSDNFKVLVSNLHVAVLLGPLTLIALARFKELPRFLKMILCLVPPFVLVHYIVGTVIETRLWLPVFAAIIPPAIFSLRVVINESETDVPKIFPQ